MSLKRFGLALIALLVVASLLAGCQQGKVLKIGYLTEQTGAEAYIAQASTPALEDHIAKINEPLKSLFAFSLHAR